VYPSPLFVFDSDSDSSRKNIPLRNGKRRGYASTSHWVDGVSVGDFFAKAVVPVFPATK